MTSEEALLSPLGKQVSYPKQYDPSLLYPISRSINRNQLNLEATTLPFFGVDIWDASELCYRNPKGKPIVALGQFVIPCESEKLVESKSLKLYLNSYANMRFADEDSFLAQIKQDLSRACGHDVTITLRSLSHHSLQETVILQPPGYHCLDNLDVAIEDSNNVNPNVLQTAGSQKVSEKLCSHIFKSNCPVTTQPDWASIFIEYTGIPIDHAGLLRYIVSYHDHTEFHEHCVERMFMDIMRACQPEKLYIYAQYTRRGGLCITPIRSNYPTTFTHQRGIRQ